LLGITTILLVTQDDYQNKNNANQQITINASNNRDLGKYSFSKMETIVNYQSPQYRPSTTNSTIPTSTIIPTRISGIPLAQGLSIAEYYVDISPKITFAGLDSKGNAIIHYYFDPLDLKNRSELGDIPTRYPSRGSKYHWLRTGSIDGKPFVAKEEWYEKDGKRIVRIAVQINKIEVYKVDCIPSPTNAIISAWIFGNDWYIQSHCYNELEIIKNGVFINHQYGYDETVALQLLAGKPFYLFRTGNVIGMVYDQTTMMLGYNEILGSYCCEGWPPSPQHYENLVLFYARRGSKLFEVIITKD